MNTNKKINITVQSIDKKQIYDSKGVPFNCYYVHSKDGAIFTAYENTYGFSYIKPHANLELEYYERNRNNFIYKNIVKISPHYEEDDILKPTSIPTPTITTSNTTYVNNVPSSTVQPVKTEEKSFMEKTIDQLTPEETNLALKEILKVLINGINNINKTLENFNKTTTSSTSNNLPF